MNGPTHQMCRFLLSGLTAIWLTFMATTPPLADGTLSQADPRILVKQLVGLAQSSNFESSQLFSYLDDDAVKFLRAHSELIEKVVLAGDVKEVELVRRQVTRGDNAILLYDLVVTHENGLSHWWIGYRPDSTKINFVFDVSVATTPTTHVRSELTQRALDLAQKAHCAEWSTLCDQLSPLGEERTVEFLIATTRREIPGASIVSFTGDRAPNMTFGAAKVSIPNDPYHHFGRVELPHRYKLFGLSVYEEKLDPTKHFVIREVRKLTDAQWDELLGDRRSDEALVFVHGYHTSFEDALYREAQIIWDLQYPGPAILFTWASRGGASDYAYDQQSALIARDSFSALIAHLKQLGVDKINVVAHSMGNLVVVDALARAQSNPPVKLKELILAAPDLDWDYFEHTGPALMQLADGVTLYASSADKAMMASKLVAKVPRAGDVINGEPIIIPGIEAIDVTAVGDELFGINHDTFSSNRAVIDDIGLVLSTHLHPPGKRLREIIGMPAGVIPSKFWKYAN
jgi:esterase/lipase superfamily enzyme